MYIEGMDVEKGIARRGSEARYRKSLVIFCRDVENFLSIFCEIPNRQELCVFVSMIRNIKDASAIIGAFALSREAEMLERAGEKEDADLIQKRLFVFYEDLQVMIIRIRTALETKPEICRSRSSEGQNKVQNLRNSLKSKDIRAIVQNFDKFLSM
jgi:HPt (histidine-containing phosphotransfer) domain-containing protein